MAQSSHYETLRHKVYLYGNPINVTSPSTEEISQLYDNLENLVKKERLVNTNLLSDTKDRITQSCKGESFRISTKTTPIQK